MICQLLPDSSNNSLFADDTNVFLSHKSLDHLIEIMNSELIIIANWFKANRLSLNLEKTNLIIFSSLRKKLSTIKHLYINEIPIVQTRLSKFLGVIVDEHLTWRDHVLAVSNKIAKNIGVLPSISLTVTYCGDRTTKPTLITCKNMLLELSVTFPGSRALNQF